MSKHEYGPAVV